MSIATHAELKTAIEKWLARSGDTQISDNSADFIVLAEGMLNFGTDEINPLRVRDMETISSLTPSSGVVTLPSTFLEPRRVVEKASVRRPLEYITPEMADYYYPDRASGLANHYTIIGSSLYTFPLAANDIEVEHYRTIPPLASNDPNWLLTKSPDIYLRASLFQAAMFIRDDEEAVKQGAILKAFVAGMNSTNMRANHVNAGVYLRGPTP